MMCTHICSAGMTLFGMCVGRILQGGWLELFSDTVELQFPLPAAARIEKVSDICHGSPHAHTPRHHKQAAVGTEICHSTVTFTVGDPKVTFYLSVSGNDLGEQGVVGKVHRGSEPGQCYECHMVFTGK